MSEASNDLLQQVDQHLSQANQAWLLGAGISKDAGLPLMKDLTARVFPKAEGTVPSVLNRPEFGGDVSAVEYGPVILGGAWAVVRVASLLFARHHQDTKTCTRYCFH